MVDSVANPTELDGTLPQPGIPLPPTQHERPYSDGEPMETQRYQFQMELIQLIPA